jgi:hypothetical protein
MVVPLGEGGGGVPLPRPRLSLPMIGSRPGKVKRNFEKRNYLY